MLSRKAVLEEESAEKKRETLETLEEGKVLKGTVKNITEYGAFVDLGGIDGLLHITDMSWGRINHPSEVFNVGDEVKVKVLKFDRETERVSLGFKQLKADPWTTATIKYPAGARVKGKVVSLTDYGAFVELEEGVEGLIHVSEMSWTKKVKHPSKVLDRGPGGRVPGARHRPGGAPHQPRPEADRAQPLGAARREVPGRLQDQGQGPQPHRLRRLRRDRGGHRRPGPHLRPLAGPSASSTRPRSSRRATTVEAIVLNIDAENQRLSLGIKQLATDMWDEFFAHHKVGDIVEGKIVRMTNFGAFVELHEGIEGLVHVSELDEKRIEKPEEAFKVGDDLPDEDHQDQRGREEDRALASRR